MEAEPTHCTRVQCSDGESSTRIVNTSLFFAYVVLSASCYTNRQHVLYQPLHSAPSCYALVVKLLRMRGWCK